MHVRKTTNIEVVRRLDDKLFKEDAGDKLSGSANHIWWLAYVDGKIAGFAGLQVFASQNYGYLLRAGVLPEFRGLGLQKALIDARDREAKRLKLECNITYTAAWNHASSNNLIACGYRLYTPQYAWGLKHALYFMKQFKYRS